MKLTHQYCAEKRREKMSETEKTPAAVENKPNKALQLTGQVINEIAGKLPSRKLAVWTAATIAFFMGKIDPDMWVYVSFAYLGTQAILDYGKAKITS